MYIFIYANFTDELLSISMMTMTAKKKAARKKKIETGSAMLILVVCAERYGTLNENKKCIT